MVASYYFTFTKFLPNFQIIGQFEETKMQRDLRVNEQIDKKTYSFDILESTLLRRKIRALDHVTEYLETLNIELLTIADELPPTYNEIVWQDGEVL
ncbi:hypothetical protein D4L85_16485 [Chryseolinea soli]|uniref:Uncharacterized protein n=1 Tax=Chryseolinea soli TaxID=2321403 RepID=A0A385STD6_9BACT|nr:hypothetical protein D4L85_16485 [Chryseolinea soli]